MEEFEALPQSFPPWPPSTPLPAPEAFVPSMTLRQLSPADVSSVKDTLATYIRRVYLDKLPRDDGKALEADWSRRSCGVRELASRLLWRWPVVQQEAANHLSLNELARIYPPKGKQLGRLIGLDDVVLARHIFVGIVGFPDFIFSKLRQLHDFESVDEPPRKRGRATGSFADPVCASSATSVACASCAARCVSCEAGCTCTQWDMTNCAELDGVTNCYRCYAALCGTGATPKRVKHLLDGNPIIVSNAPTAELATPAAREMCETMMETMRTLAGRRTHATQHATSGGRVQVPLPRHLGWRTSTKQAKKKFFTSALKHLAEAPTVGPTNFDTYEKHRDGSQLGHGAEANLGSSHVCNDGSTSSDPHLGLAPEAAEHAVLQRTVRRQGGIRRRSDARGMEQAAEPRMPASSAHGARHLGRFQRAAGLPPPPPRDGPGCAY